jgi:hypothetical protein
MERPSDAWKAGRTAYSVEGRPWPMMVAIAAVCGPGGPIDPEIPCDLLGACRESEERPAMASWTNPAGRSPRSPTEDGVSLKLRCVQQ